MSAPGSDDTLHIACGVDDPFAMPMAVTLYSVADHLPPGTKVIFHIMDGGVSPENRARVERVVCSLPALQARVEWISCNLSRFEGFFTTDTYNETIYMRLLLPELLPDLSRVIYLDSDILALQSIVPLWQTDLGNSYLAAVQDISLPYTHMFGDTDLAIPADRLYFNVGVALMNLERLRQDGIIDKTMQYLARYRGHPEQHALNAYTVDQWLPLSYRWNLQTECFRLERQTDSELKREVQEAVAGGRLKQDTVLVHFTGRAKPWSGALLHPYRQQYHACLKRSGWMSVEEFRHWKQQWWAAALKALAAPLLRRFRRR
jgi:lipopolysaccharide biosynthesis glycosyltransferase